MATEKQKNASRANGAKSHGPVTPEGKARVAQNPIRHGLASKAVVLSNESTAEYEALAQSYRDEWQPQSQTEDDLVTQLINAQWRLRRIAAIETATLDLEIELRRKPFDDAVPSGSEEMRLSDAFLSVSIHNGLSVDQISRYETRYSNLYQRALKALSALRRTQNCTSKPEQPAPNAPSPSAPEPTPVTQPTEAKGQRPPSPPTPPPTRPAPACNLAALREKPPEAA